MPNMNGDLVKLNVATRETVIDNNINFEIKYRNNDHEINFVVLVEFI